MKNRPSIVHTHSIHQAQTRLLKKKEKKEAAHDICHSIPTLWSMIWSQRSYVLADSQSIFRAEATDRRSQSEGETLLVCVLSFLFFKRNTVIHHVSSLRGPPRDVYQRKWIFKALPVHKNDWEHVQKHKSLSTVSGHFRGAVTTRSKTVSSFSQSLPGVWKPFQSEQAINSC